MSLQLYFTKKKLDPSFAYHAKLLKCLGSVV